MTALNGILHKLWFSGFPEEVVRFIGNCISTPHAASTILNMVAFLCEDFGNDEIRDIFKKLMSQRFHADNMRVYAHEGGRVICRAVDEIPATMPMHDFVDVHLHHEDGDMSFRCERGIDLWSALLVMMHTHRPDHIFVKPFEQAKLMVEISRPFRLLSDIHHFQMPGRIVMHLHPNVETSEEILLTPCTVAVTCEGPFVLHWGTSPSTQAVKDIIADQFDDFHGIPTNQFCVPIDVDGPPPFHFMIMPSVLHSFAFVALETMQISTTCGFVTFASNDVYMDDLIEALQQSKISQIMQVFGWRFMCQVPDSEECPNRVLQMMPIPGAFSLAPHDAKRCLMTILFLAQVQQDQQIETEPWIDVELKLLGFTAWKGRLHTSDSCSRFEYHWNRIGQIFHDKFQLRFLLAGKQMNPQWPIHDYHDQ